MIIFYNKNTGEIKGRIDGRIHNDNDMRMWLGSRDENKRMVINWEAVKLYKNKDGVVIAADYEPQHEQKQLVADIESGKKSVYDHKIDIKTNRIVKK